MHVCIYMWLCVYAQVLLTNLRTRYVIKFDFSNIKYKHFLGTVQLVLRFVFYNIMVVVEGFRNERNPNTIYFRVRLYKVVTLELLMSFKMYYVHTVTKFWKLYYIYIFDIILFVLFYYYFRDVLRKLLCKNLQASIIRIK